jgi:hypothetical protein
MSNKFTVPDEETGYFWFVLKAIQRGCEEPLEFDAPVEAHEESPVGSMISRLINAVREK